MEYKWTPFLESQLNEKILGVDELEGGDISSAFKVTTNKDTYFLKINNSNFADGMFKAEAEGLALLKVSGMNVPDIVFQGSLGKDPSLILNFVEGSRKGSKEEMTAFGNQLGQLHKNSSEFYGLEQDNFIGSLPQINGVESNWSRFYGNHRLKPQFLLARKTGMLNATQIPNDETLFEVLRVVLGSPPPSLIHGDLWSGNYLMDLDGKAWLVDPAVYYGHGEVDLAMSKLFGGFDPSFYAGYEEVMPLDPEWEDRFDLYQLYYLLVHLNLFGRSYYRAVSDIMERYFGKG